MPSKKDQDAETHKSQGTKISFSDLEKSMIPFTGDDTYPVTNWIEEFEDTAEIMEWSDMEKLVYGKRLLEGTAKLFLRSIGSVKSWDTLKKLLQEEFRPKLNSAIVHKKLASRKMKNEETFQQYFLHMKELALHASIEDAALMVYLIDGIRDTETNKAILYGAKTLNEFRTKLNCYEELRKKTEEKNNIKVNIRRNSSTGEGDLSITNEGRKSVVKRCFNCGDTDHLAPDCKKGVKCFRCKEFGHKSTECNTQPKKYLNIEKDEIEEKIPYKKIKINDIDMIALIDTGSDVNLIKMTKLTEFGNDRLKYDKGTKLSLTGISKTEITTEGYFAAKLQIDDCFADIIIHVVKDEDIPVSLILGNPILRDFEISFTSSGITVKKITHLTLLTVEKAFHNDYTVGDVRFCENIKKMIKEYKPKQGKKDSNIEMKIILTDEIPFQQNTRCLSPLQKDEVNKQIEDWTVEENDQPSKNTSHIKIAQDYDVKIKVSKEIFEKETYKDFYLQNGTLIEVKDERKLIEVPKKMHSEIIQKNDDIGHINIDKTEKLCNREYVIEELERKVLDSCAECFLILHKRRKKKRYLHPLDKGKEVIQKKRNERYAVRKVGNYEVQMNTMSSGDLMKPWISPNYDYDSSGSDESAGWPCGYI